MIRRLIDGVIVRQYEKEICDVDIDVIESGEYKVYLITVTFDIDPFQVMANAFGGSSVQETRGRLTQRRSAATNKRLKCENILSAIAQSSPFRK